MTVHRQNITDSNPVEFDGFATTCKQYLQVQQGRERKLNEFLAFNERDVLPNAGTVSKKAADEHAHQEYQQFEARRREYKENLGEAEAIKALEDTAKALGNDQDSSKDKK